MADPAAPGPGDGPTETGATEVDATPRGPLSPELLESYGVDCPIPPAVWRQFTDPTAKVDLVLEVDEDAGAPSVARALVVLLREAAVDGRGDGSIELLKVLATGSFIALSASIDQLVIGVLPLTSWQPLMEKAGRLSKAEIDEEIADIEGQAPLRERPGWELQDLGRFRWLASQMHRVLGDDADERLWDLCNHAAAGANRSTSVPIASVAFNRPVRPAVLESRVTVKADAADRVFDIDASSVTWAVIDSGIDRDNPAFRRHPTPTELQQEAKKQAQSKKRSSKARAVTVAPYTRIVASYDVPRAVKALRDDDPTVFVGLDDPETWERFIQLAETTTTGQTPVTDPAVRHHGTHVAGILAADEREFLPEGDRAPLVGVCPTVRLVDVKVFDEAGRSEELWVLVAMQLVHRLNATERLGRQIHGVNMSLSTPYDVDAQACGWTPVCTAAERLVDAGVAVVAAAGNQAFDASSGSSSLGTGFRFLSITDPGNAESAITVGATHKCSPVKFGPIAGSGRGPTADGRHKPDLLAPGHHVVGPTFGSGPQEMTGTSQAAPHVSGVAAMLLGRYAELRGKPRRVKSILCETATDLGRLQDFQGAGLVDALRALQRP